MGSPAPHQCPPQSRSANHTSVTIQSNLPSKNKRKPHLAEPRKLVINRPNRLLDRLLERAADAHDLADGLHAAAEQAADAAELLEVPARDLHDDIVQARLEARRGHLRHRVLDLVQRDAEPELRGDERERVPGRLGRERGRAREPRVDLPGGFSIARARGDGDGAHLDDAVLARGGVQRVLDVTFTNDTKVTNDVDSSGAEHVVVRIGERL